MLSLMLIKAVRPLNMPFVFCIFVTDPESFALGDCVTVPYAQAVLYCLSSNFLEVKQLACTLLQKLPSKTVGLQVCCGSTIWLAPIAEQY